MQQCRRIALPLTELRGAACDCRRPWIRPVSRRPRIERERCRTADILQEIVVWHARAGCRSERGGASRLDRQPKHNGADDGASNLHVQPTRDVRRDARGIMCEFDRASGACWVQVTGREMGRDATCEPLPRAPHSPSALHGAERRSRFDFRVFRLLSFVPRHGVRTGPPLTGVR